MTMKNNIIILTFLLVLSSCQQTYLLSFFVNEKPVVENLEIKAVDDVSAYEKAVGEINRICEGKEDEWLYAKLNYTLYNGEDKIYTFSTVIPELLKKQIAAVEIEQRRAFAGANFGMSVDEVHQLPFYKDFNFANHKKLNDGLYSRRVTIGGGEYYVSLSFTSDDKLYQIAIIGDNHSPYSFSYVQDDVENIKNAIYEVYKEPLINNGCPTLEDAYRDKAHDVYGWEIGTKKIAIMTSHRESDFCAFTLIVDTELSAQKKAQEQEEKKEKSKSSSNLF